MNDDEITIENFLIEILKQGPSESFNKDPTTATRTAVKRSPGGPFKNGKKPKKPVLDSDEQAIPIKHRNGGEVLLDDVITVRSFDRATTYEISLGELLRGLILLKRENPDYFK